MVLSRQGRAPWNRSETARDYARFVRCCPMLRELAAALVGRLVDPDDRHVVDLGAGTGVCTAEIVAGLSGQATVWAVEPAEAMILRARRDIEDPRVRWLLGDIRDLARLRPAGSMDAVICNASIWLDRDPLGLTATAARLLRRGGRLGFTVPAEYLGEIAHLLCPEARAFARTVEEVRALACAALESPAGPAPESSADPLPPSASGLVAALGAQGYVAVDLQPLEVLVTAEDRARWITLPPQLDALLPGVTNGRRVAAAREILSRASLLPPMRQVWTLVQAVRA